MMCAYPWQSVAAAKLTDLDGNLHEYDQQGPTYLAAAVSVSTNIIDSDKTVNSLQHASNRHNERPVCFASDLTIFDRYYLLSVLFLVNPVSSQLHSSPFLKFQKFRRI